MEHRILARKPLGNPRRLWRQDNFILSTFSARAENMRDAMENCAEAGFNLLELGWAAHDQAEEAVRLCEEIGIDLIFQDFTVFGGMQEHHIDRHISPDTAKTLADRLRPWKHTVGYYVWDEPYVEDQLRETRYQMDLFQQEDPACLPFTVAIPSYNRLYTWENGEFAPYLRRYMDIIDPPVLSLDYYPIGLRNYTDEKQLDESLFWCDIGLMRQLGREYELPVWFYYQGVNLYKYHRFTFPMVRMMMYAAAMYGFKGLQQYTAVDSVIDGKGGKGPFFHEKKQIHSEFRRLGNTLMALENKYVFHSRDLLPNSPYYKDFADNIEDSAVLLAMDSPRTSMGEFTDEYGNTYLLILNRDFDRQSNIIFALKERSRIYEVSRETGRQSVLFDNVNGVCIRFAPGDGRLFRIQPSSEEPYTVEYRLEK